MKNIIIFMTLCVMTIFLASCEKNTKEASCTTQNASCELEKPWCVLKVKSLRDTNSVDAFGNKLKLGSYYVRNSRTKMLFKVTYHAQGGTYFISPVTLDNVGEDVGCPVLETAKMEEGTVSLAGWYDFVGDIVCLKNAEISLNTEHMAQTVDWIDYK